MQSIQLNWTLNGFDKFSLITIPSMGDGHCFFHSLLNAFFLPYRTGLNDGYAVTKTELVTKFRSELADKLGQPIDPLNPKSKIYWEVLGQGNLALLAKDDPSYSLKSLQNRLRSSACVGNEFFEMISDVINHDIYLLDSTTQDLYWMGDEYNIIYKGRPSIVLVYNGIDHYDLIGLQDGDKINTRFKLNNDFIAFLRKRQLKKLVPDEGGPKSIVHDKLLA